MMENHTKYAREITLDIEDSLLKIVQKIDENSVILDVGCSSGALGRYLVGHKACIVDGVDIDPSAIDVCQPEYRKVVIRNLESESIAADFQEGAYDYIVVADVIEHISYPKYLLEQLRQLVKPHGKIIFSVPNITHIASAIELLNGQLNYSQSGLLDSTHVRFYSYQGLVDTLAASGIYVWNVDTVQRNLSETEFSDTHTKLFPKEWLDTVIHGRPDALVYQWIFSTKIYPNLEAVDQSMRAVKFVNPIFTKMLYWSTQENGAFNEADKLFGYKTESAENEISIEFRFNYDIKNLTRIRVDPASEKKSIWIKRAYIVNESNFICWHWRGHRATDDVGNGRWSDLAPEQGLILIAEDNDPHWIPPVPPKVLSKLRNGAKFVVVLSEDSALIDAEIEAGWKKKKVALDLFTEMSRSQLIRIDQLVDENAQKDRVLLEVKNYIEQQEKAISDLQCAVISGQQENIRKQQEFERILHSASWRLTKPFRYLRRKISALSLFGQSTKRDVGSIASAQSMSELLATPAISELDSLPLQDEIKIATEFVGEQIKQQIPITRYSGDQQIIYVPRLNADQLEEKLVKLICFYQPQFQIKSEQQVNACNIPAWSEVQSAKASFSGHYQPHVPGELGYYDLQDVAIQSRQVELAKLYGIGGFCFHFHYYEGKAYFEQSLLNYLSCPELDLPFCLCWFNDFQTAEKRTTDNANELPSHKDDDLAFIEHAAKYMRDPRYIRILGRPVLLVYKVELLKNPKNTANGWSNWCRDNGLGEIYLVYVQSSTCADPQDYEFNAAVEFPPHTSLLPEVTETVTPLPQSSRCRVFDAKELESRSKQYPLPHYRLFRTVLPSWDDTPYQQQDASVLLNMNPASYQRWLQNAVRDTLQHNSKEECLVFINSWNAWEKGAHLEPDQRNGYAYLESTRLALLKSSIAERRIDLIEMQKVLAIVIHVFYVDIFDEILNHLDEISQVRIKLYVTTTAENEFAVRSRLNARQHNFVVEIVENRGRDILPFMRISQQVIRAGHKLFIKVHTKKSLHRIDGDGWREDLFQKLLADESILQAIATLSQNADVGIMGPAGHLASMTHYFGGNQRRVEQLSSRLGVEVEELSSLEFVAGSMFFGRIDALLPLLNLAIDAEDYENESGQLDATLAHAIERLFSVSAYSAGLRTISFTQ